MLSLPHDTEYRSRRRARLSSHTRTPLTKIPPMKRSLSAGHVDTADTHHIFLIGFFGEDGARSHGMCPVADCDYHCADEF
ncbi:hypothetical protein AZE42_07888 [Rhizopogon vesiculosus]|uniref:Uncharacterized protein n=1 Tax=Rhizopogon vesiculosus TaxID=180088 RepID=A0A1J8QHL7_9AGAM|nr:hypothetical protein AZE42_07888 [Rhizopogon vesiculosus]